MVTVSFEMTRQFVQYQMVAFCVMMILIVLFFNRGVGGFVESLMRVFRGPAKTAEESDA